jgi:hypothetical protein
MSTNDKEPVHIKLQSQKENQAVKNYFWATYYAATRTESRKLLKPYIDANAEALDDTERGIEFETTDGSKYLMQATWQRTLEVFKNNSDTQS